MVFSSTVFLLLFLPVTCAVYFLIPASSNTGKNIVLLTASLIFYGWGEPKYILVMLFSILFNYLLALAMQAKKSIGSQRGTRAVLLISVAGNLFILAFFKYTDFLLQTVNSLTGSGFGLLSIALPIGISFYTFQTMSYVIDVYRGEIKAQKSLLAFAMYVTLFPQLIAGPIVRYRDVEIALTHRQSSSAQISEGISRFILGFCKKVLLANQVYIIWHEISQMETISVAAAWLGAVAFSFQIYFDFSGYSDMAIGLGKIFGFDYLENFHYPYISASITEFWRRWHISLSSWFKEYVYIPLGGNQKGTARQVLNIAVVWALTGLWHGASWNFVLWGLYFAVILIAEKLFLLKLLKKLPAPLRHLYALFFILCGWVIFAMTNLSEMTHYFSMLFGSSGIWADNVFFYFIKSYRWLLLACCFCATPLPAYLWDKVQDKLERFEKFLAFLEVFVLLTLFLLAVGFLVSGSYNPFLYFRF